MSRRTSSRASPGVLLLVGLVALLIYLYEQGSFDRFLASAPPTPSAINAPGQARQLSAANSGSGAWYQVYFTKPFYPETAADRQGGIDAALVADLDAAQRTIDVASFDFDLDSVAQALLRAKARGVKIRVVADLDANQDAPTFVAATDKLEKAGIPITFDERAAFMHNKFAIVDDATVWTGSWNLTVNDTYRNNNNALRFAVPQLTENYKRRFEQLFAGQMGSRAPKDTPNPSVALPNDVKVENYFSPSGGAAGAIEKRLRGASKSIRVLAFSYTSDEQARVLMDKAKAGVKVQGVFEARNAQGSGAEYGALKKAGLDVWQDGNCYVMHHKVYILDAQTVITGSYNFTASAERENDENLLIVDDPTLANFYNQEFDRIYAQAQNPTRCGGSHLPLRSFLRL